jgi:pimeloyl-ACP methyl ester carboxylesterase
VLTDRGSGPASVFAHGMQLDRSLFDAQLDDLSDAFRTIAYDSRAHEDRGREPYDLYDLVDDFVGLLDELGIERCLLAGMSMGGYMAVRAALRVPERLYGIVTIGSSAVPFAPDEIAEWRAGYEDMPHLETIGVERSRVDTGLNFSSVTHAQRPEVVEAWVQRVATRAGIYGWHEFLSWGYQDDVREEFSRSDVPILICHGDEDAAIPLAHALETYSLAKRARLLVVPYAGHAVNLEHPEIVNGAIRAFAADLGM